ncbi:MAG: hypothetical protein WDM96_16345 [Lacunisphaera sp.]
MSDENPHAHDPLHRISHRVLGVAAFMTNAVLSRLLAPAARADRDPQGLRFHQRADRRALPEIRRVIGFAGTALGFVGGLGLGWWMLGLYAPL